ncbi:putative UDP-rhamnose:rhamnosyltransferase 1 [Olea europaea var. sylvestris]|uniref:putative UDP-rhamnose:rhamnosyltransferase 1 n=1 Tax=Olea europaea var. sylvestris TaxID=158386 RepID=UPI000C1D5DF1|nr:putative UDP-rhamnose:rhamnosyltransferase 1 [Olea europaea var. sylvestris]
MASSSKLHVVMFPWLAFGHIIPFFELSKFIAQKGHKISFVSTPRNIDRLPKIPSHLVSYISLVKIPLPKVEGLHESAEATMDIRNEDMDHLKKAFDGMETELARFLEESRPDWIIYDFAPHWLPPVAARLGISRAFFLIFNAWILAFFGPLEILINDKDERTGVEDFMIPPKWVKFETKMAYRRYEANWIVGATHKNDSGFSDSYRVGKVIEGCEVIIPRYCNEFGPEWLKLLEELYHRPVVPLGLMPPRVGEDESQSWVSIKTWLDNQNKRTVVYVALGSEVTPSQDQLNELALGLELSGVPFFWALRKPSGSGESYSVVLPDGFEERIQGRGMVWKSWAPQLKILSHDSVGAFLTHCGWSSFIEGLAFGLPLIALPFLVDQGLNARVIADRHVGIEIPKNDEDGTYTKN